MTAVLAPAELSDAEIATRVAAGERDLFEILVRRHNQRMYRAARAVTRSDADAEDVLQQTWLNVFKNLGRFRGEASFATWATRIAVNEAIAVARKRPLVAEVAEIPSELTPEIQLDRAQLGALLERCLATIPQGNREVMVLRDVLEMDTAETAACLGLTEEAVRVRLHRGRAAVAAVLTATIADVYHFDGARCDRITAYVMRSVLELS
ncbi:MAG: sigma-70 family RNA polymerase sigma factor [Deltaproteobacteria bacterium]|nr:sigma-70 family RNA polymerase sigma factor [Deltaproteobacteria bacterium]